MRVRSTPSGSVLHSALAPKLRRCHGSRPIRLPRPKKRSATAHAVPLKVFTPVFSRLTDCMPAHSMARRYASVAPNVEIRSSALSCSAREGRTIGQGAAALATDCHSTLSRFVHFRSPNPRRHGLWRNSTHTQQHKDVSWRRGACVHSAISSSRMQAPKFLLTAPTTRAFVWMMPTVQVFT
ncbi:hypothetical protein D3C71_1342480 [compost metagenome]